MRDWEFIKTMLIEKHKTIDDYEYLENYIKFLMEYKLIIEVDDYVEKHHILPTSVFPEFKKEAWNIINLKYEDHINAHLLLFKAINIRTYQRPLNWMLKYYKNTQEISNAAKRGWEKLKNNPEKLKNFKEKRSNIMKKLSSEEQKRRANVFWNNITEKQLLDFSIKMKEYWTDEKKKEKSINMKEYYLDSNNRDKKIIEAKKVWENRSEEDRIKFNQKMTKVNKDFNKRKNAGEKIKKLWENEDFLQKMKNRKSRKVDPILIIKPDGQEIIFESMSDLKRTYNFSLHLIRKYRNTNIQISEKDSIKNRSLLKCKIKQ